VTRASRPGWRDPILSHFTPEIAAVSRLTVVGDPDHLLTEAGVVEGIRTRGFAIVPFEDHCAFRYAYESQFRRRWDNGETTNLVVVLRTALADTNALPFDLVDRARRDSRLLSFSLAALFPRLAPHVVAELTGKIPFYGLRHLVRPGLTGWAQVKYQYAGTEARECNARLPAAARLRDCASAGHNPGGHAQYAAPQAQSQPSSPPIAGPTPAACAEPARAME